MAKPIRATKKQIMRMKEGLARRTSQGPNSDQQFVTYSGHNEHESLSRRIKTDVLPKLTELLYSLEGVWNSYVVDHSDSKNAKEKEKTLKPIEKLYRALEESEDEMIEVISDLTKKYKGKE